MTTWSLPVPSTGENFPPSHSHSQSQAHHLKISVHAITARVNPLKSLMYSQHQQTIPTAGGVPVPSRPDPPSGLEVLESENFRLQCFNTLTGTKFLLFTDNLQPNVDLTMHKVYDLYSDFVMKNPFYQLEMPIRCEAFERKLNSYIREINNSR